jgi:heat shock protein HtpX
MYNEITSNKRKTYLIITGFLTFIIALGWFVGVGLGYGYGIFLFSVIFSIGTSLFSYYSGDKVALASNGAKQIQQQDNPYLYRMVENLCISQGMPMPKVYIIPSPALNAFACGRDPKHASVAFTTGIIAALENEELEGVVAHELAHIKNYDIRLMTIVVVLVGLISLLVDFALRMSLFGGGRSNDNKVHPALLVIGIIAMILAPFIAMLIQLAISRRREFLADASGALMTRYPEGLASALEKISRSHTPLEKANTATAHMFISNPFKKKGMSNLFSTHPPAEDRIAKLRGMGV